MLVQILPSNPMDNGQQNNLRNKQRKLLTAVAAFAAPETDFWLQTALLISPDWTTQCMEEKAKTIGSLRAQNRTGT